MHAIPTTTGDILTGTTTDNLGDTTEATTVQQAGVLASVAEQRHRPSRRVEDRLQNVRDFIIRLPYGTTITTANRFRDASGRIFVIDTVTTLDNPVTRQDVRLDARLVTT